MRRVGFIGCYDKTDLIIYIAKILTATGRRVLVIDSTTSQKAKYVVPAIKPTVSYVTEFEEIDVAVGFRSEDDIKEYLGIQNEIEQYYDFILIDADTHEAIESFHLLQADINYFVTSFDLYSLKRGLEILSGLPQVIQLTKILYSRNATNQENEYLDYLSLGYKIEWLEERIYFPFEVGDQSVIAENQRVSKIKFRRLSEQYKEGLIYISQQLLETKGYAEIKKLFKQLERGV